MRTYSITTTIAAVALAVSSCATKQHYAVSSVERSRILIDSRYDSQPDAEAAAFLAPYKSTVDSLMNPVMGEAACDMSANRPESRLSNLLADILVWSSSQFGETPDFAVYNMGGIRASLSKGKVTRGNILDVAPFENKICFLTLKGSDVQQLFSEIAKVGGEGVSHAIRLEISSDGKLLSALVNGKPVDPSANYRIATLDYLAQGNDHLDAFKLKTDVLAPSAEENNVRHLIEKYFMNAAANGQPVKAEVEGRITVK